MCCFGVADVFLEDPPPEKKKEEKKEVKKEESVKKNYVLVSDELNLQPIVSQHRFLHLDSLPPSLPNAFHITDYNIWPSPIISVNQLSRPPFYLQRQSLSRVRQERATHPQSWRRDDA